jgi:YVTN family beta-propeller protein
VDPTGKFAYVTNSGSATVSGYAIEPTAGALTPIKGSPFAAGSRPVSVAVDPTAKFVYVTNAYAGMGSGNVSAYSIGSDGALTPIPGSPFVAGSSPRSVAVDPAGKFAYVTNENSNTVSGYTIDPATGALTSVKGSPFAAGSGPFSVAFAGRTASR